MTTPDITVSRSELQRLVFAARHVAFDGYFDGCDDDARAQLQELDAASEAFAATFPWEDEPSLTADEEAELVARINANPNLHPKDEMTPQFVAMNGRDKWETLVLHGLMGTDESCIEALTKTLREEADRLESLLSDRAKLEEALNTIAKDGVGAAADWSLEECERYWAAQTIRCRSLARAVLNRSTDRAT